MNMSLGATAVLAGVAFGSFGVLVFLFILFLGLLALGWYWVVEVAVPLKLRRLQENPILVSNGSSWWESEAVFNPAAFVDNGKVHLLYRAMGTDGVSRIGYASSKDGIHFERYPHPVFDYGPQYMAAARASKKRNYRPLSYNTDLYASGGGWGGTEDPRAVTIDDRLYMSFGIFENWESMRLAVTSLHLDELRALDWSWQPHVVMSPARQTHKNWVLFPEKIRGSFAILHALTPSISVEYVRELEQLKDNPIQSNNQRGGRAGAWDAFVRGAAAPPIKTEDGWLLFYHGMDPAHPAVGYKVGAMLLDLEDPTIVRYRSAYPVLEPSEWYENDWKPGVVYASGAVVFNGELIVYYGGGDKHIAAAKADLRDFLRRLKGNQHATLEPVGVQ